jgi:hypothetical protein
MKALLLAFALAVPVAGASQTNDIESSTTTETITLDDKFAAMESRIWTLEREVSSLQAQLEGQAEAAFETAKKNDGKRFLNAFESAGQERRLNDLEWKERSRRIH